MSNNSSRHQSTIGPAEGAYDIGVRGKSFNGARHAGDFFIRSREIPVFHDGAPTMDILVLEKRKGPASSCCRLTMKYSANILLSILPNSDYVHW